MTITIVAPACAFTDYGYTAIELFDRLREYGYDTKFKPLSVCEQSGKRRVPIPQVVKDNFVTVAEGFEVWVCDVSEIPQPGNDALLVSTLHGITKDCAKALNKFNSIACVSGFEQIEIAQKLGVTIPVSKIHPGVDLSIFDNEYRNTLKSVFPPSQTRLLRFLASGKNERDLVLEAWKESFKGVQDVRLCVMCDDADMFSIQDSRVNIVDYPVNNRQLANVMANHNAFIVPSTKCDFRIFEQCFAASLPTIGITLHRQGLTAWSKLKGTHFTCDKMELIGQMRFAYQDRKALEDTMLLRPIEGWESIDQTVKSVYDRIPK
jgi:hypothetical protein